MRADRRATQRSAFTLIEILIVVIILGILATIIISLFGNSSKDAGGASLKDNLRCIRSAIQIYSAQHGRYPAQATFETQMTQYTNPAGATSTTRTGTYTYGPYILTLPPLPVGTDRGATTVTTTTYTAGHGWQYDATSGAFKANCPDTDKDDAGVPYNTY
jgi:general secretion pathway protein G